MDVTDASFEQDVIAASDEAPVVVDFWAAWCGPCRALGPVLEAATEEQGVVLAKLDVDANPEVARRFNISSIPAVKAFRNGHVVAEFVGARSRQSVDAWLAELTQPAVADSVDDPELAHRLAHPRYEVDKVYEVETWTQPTDADLDRLRRGVELEDGPTRPAEVRRIDGARIELTLHEGRNRQVKRMLEAVGHRVKRLHRSRYGPLLVGGLEPGAWRELEPSEVERLRVQ